MTNDLYNRIYEHHANRGQKKTFAGRYYCYNLVYYEEFSRAIDAIEREKQIKGWTRKRKMELIKLRNPNLDFLNKSI